MSHSGPDFQRTRTALLRLGEPDRVPLCEAGVDQAVKEAFLGRPIESMADEVEFWATAGYDFVPISLGIRQFMGPDFARLFGDTLDHKTMSVGNLSVFGDGTSRRAWAREGSGVIRTQDDFDQLKWPSAGDLSYRELEEVGKHLPPRMKVIAYLGYVYTTTWQLMGLEHFCTSLVDDPDLVTRLYDRIGQLQYDVFERLLDYDIIGAIWQPDDIAYTESLMLSPRHFRQYVFPWYSRMGEVCRSRGIPHLLHSDGKLDEVMPDIVEIFDAVHPFEPKAMDIVEAKRRWGDRICVIGNIDLGYTLTRGTPEEVEAEVRQRIRELAPGGGYCMSSSNSIADYVPLANFNAMREATFKYGRYPIEI